MADPVKYYVYRVTLTGPRGSRSALIKTTSLKRDPGASIYGLHARLADLELIHAVHKATVTVVPTITKRQRLKMTRWPDVLPTLLEEIA